MMALRLLMLVVVLVLAYLLVLRPTTKTEDLPPDLVQQPAAAATASGAAPAAHAHSQYKEAMDRAHEAAKQMQAERKEADSL